MLQKKYKSELISLRNPFEGIYTLEFESLNGKYKYHPGQFLHIALDEDYDGSGQWPESRCFSMQSHPDEETLKITYAVKGEFTRLMEKTLKPGLEVWLKLPYGDIFTQPHDKTKTVFIAGGTGITPFLSLFTHSSFAEYIHPKIYLGFRTKEYHIYQNELKSIPVDSLTIFYQDTDGVIDIQQIFNENGPTATYFISGPPTMIKLFKNCLIDNGVPANQVLTDDWE
jgi:ferredoxin-NADP reductase